MKNYRPARKNVLENIKCLIICRERYSRSLLRSTVINTGVKGDFVVEIDKADEISYKLVDFNFNIIIVDHDEYLDFSYMDEIKNNEHVNKIPVMIVTDQGSEVVIRKAIAKGVSGILLRPISVQTMKRSLEKTLNLIHFK